MTVRSATVEDASIITDFNCRLAFESEGLRLEPDRVRSGVEAQLEDPSRGRYVLAVRGARVVGQLAVTTEWSDWRAGYYWWIQSVFVDPAERKRGIFRILFQRVEEEALRAGDCSGLRLYVERENQRAIQAYEGVGLGETSYRIMERLFPR